MLIIGSICVVVALTLLWIILSENVSTFIIITGVAVSLLCLYFSRKYLPINKMSNVRFFRLGLYLLYLIGQVYVSAVYVIRIILVGAKVEIIQTDTEITNEFLNNVLSVSITLTPGSILLDSKNGRITVLWLKGKNDPDVDTEKAGEIIKGKLEKKLLKVQKEKRAE